VNLNTAIVKVRSLDVDGCLKSSQKRQQPSDDGVDQRVANSVVSTSGDSVQSKKLHLEPLFEPFVSCTLAASSASLVTGLVSTASQLQSVNSAVLQHAETVSSSTSGNTPIASHTVVSDIPEAAVATPSSTVRANVTEACNWRIQHLQFSAAPVVSVQSVALATSHSYKQAAAVVSQPTHEQTSDAAYTQQNGITDGIYLLWQNEDSLCWLDAAMALIVNCDSLRTILPTFGKVSCLNRLLASYDSAQVNFRRSRKLYRCHYLCGQGKAVTLETSVGQVAVKTGRGHGPLTMSLLGGSSAVIASVDLDDISSIVSADNPHSTSLEKVSQEAKRLEDKAKQIMAEAREEVFQCLQPRMHCKRGEGDSVLIALTEILSLDPAVRAHVAVHYTYSLSCTRCGHLESGT